LKALVIIPTYNECENITAIIEAVLAAEPTVDILIVDDNSPDGTASIVQDIQRANTRVHLLKRAGKLGLGTAYCEGFQYGLERNYDVVFEMDADFSHDPKELPNFLQELRTADVVIGSRYLNGGVTVVNWPLRRLILSYSANVYTRLITRLPLHDATGGFKAIKTEFLRKINLDAIHSNGYAFQIEINYKLWRAGARLKEIPIIFVDRRSGTSKMSKNIIFEAAWIVWRLALGL
jgi:dolichol-phosphate mannosyltransferase